MLTGNFKSCLKEAWADVHVPRRFLAVLTALFCLASFYPSDMQDYSERVKDRGAVAYYSEHYVRFVNTAAQALIPIVLSDKIGMVQAVYVGIATTVTTHSLKRIMNSWSSFGTRMGQRPYGKDSSNNMPSGHSSMAASAMYFVYRRYGRKHAFYLVPVTALAMYARVMLTAHTLSAVLAGCLLGIIAAAVFTSRYAPEEKATPASSPQA
jgi:membrane-associated phospholipid phosphatase